MGQIGRPKVKCHRRDVHNLSRALFDHLGKDSLGGVKYALEVDVMHLVPLTVVYFEKRLSWIDASVVDQNVNSAELIRRHFNHLVEDRSLPHVSIDRDGKPIPGADRSGKSVISCPIPVD